MHAHVYMCVSSVCLCTRDSICVLARLYVYARSVIYLYIFIPRGHFHIAHPAELCTHIPAGVRKYTHACMLLYATIRYCTLIAYAFVCVLHRYSPVPNPTSAYVVIGHSVPIRKLSKVFYKAVMALPVSLRPSLESEFHNKSRRKRSHSTAAANKVKSASAIHKKEEKKDDGKTKQKKGHKRTGTYSDGLVNVPVTTRYTSHVEYDTTDLNHGLRSSTNYTFPNGNTHTDGYAHTCVPA